MTPKAKKTLILLLTIALFIILIQVIIGGITRLTGSGLSITDWKIVTGTFPPINQADWLIEFNQYQASPQYELLNKGMSLSEFKFIYFWEWLHRVWARFGFLYLFSILVFLGLRKQLTLKTAKHLLLILFLYACQGLLGWFMVTSGLIHNPYVSHYRLAAHLLAAMFLFGYILWLIAQLAVPKEQKLHAPSLRKFGWALTLLAVVQIVFGAFMSGLRAAVHYPSWPDMNGQIIPENLFYKNPFYLNFLENITTIQFTHRGIAYLLFFLILIYWWKAKKQTATRLFNLSLMLLPIILIIQVSLGILTLLYSKQGIPVGFGVFHQMFGLLLLSNLLFLNFQYKKGLNH